MSIVSISTNEHKTEDHASSQPHFCQKLEVGRMNIGEENPIELLHLFWRLEFCHSPLEIIPTDTGQWIRQEFTGRNLPELQPQISRPFARLRHGAHLVP